jgi:uncharacterized protein (DUF58 family)
MRLRFIPGRLAIGAVAALVVALTVLLSMGAARALADWLAGAAFLALVLLALLDYQWTRRAWREANATLTRRLPQAFALGVERPVTLGLTVHGARAWRMQVFDHADATLAPRGMPMRLAIGGGQAAELEYRVAPQRRGEVAFAPAEVRVRSVLGLWDVIDRIGPTEARRVFPDFAQIARYAWLAGDRRLAEIGLKTYAQRGEGTDFKQLSEYRIGDPLRHIDWKATLKHEKPIVRQFQNERDQCVILMIDCGRRMRADDRRVGVGAAHFDQALNASMLLTYVALRQGDAVGALTFGTRPGEERWVPPRKGAATLNSLMGELYAVQPSASHSDYVVAAQELLRRQHKRALVILVTNFRDEDVGELGQALRLLRSRHLVLTASLREQVVQELMSRGAADEGGLDVAGAHLYEQARRDAFNSIAARDALMVDAEPQRLGVELVNRYQAVKKAGLI